MPPKTKKNTPKGISQALNEQIVPLVEGTAPIISHGRAEEISMRDEPLRNYKISLEDIDSAILYHIKANIRPIVMEDDTVINVPVRYAFPEMWASAQKDGALRDKDGKMLFPVIAIKRDTVTINRELGGKLDGNAIHNYRVVEKQYTRKNQYDHLNTLKNRIAVKEMNILPVPDYVTIVYSCAVYVNNQKDMNSIIEAFNFASRSYWGDREKNIFYSVIEEYPITMEMNPGENRKIYTVFNITVNAQIVSETASSAIAGAKKFISKAQVVFTAEIAS